MNCETFNNEEIIRQIEKPINKFSELIFPYEPKYTNTGIIKYMALKGTEIKTCKKMKNFSQESIRDQLVFPVL